MREQTFSGNAAESVRKADCRCPVQYLGTFAGVFGEVKGGKGKYSILSSNWSFAYIVY